MRALLRIRHAKILLILITIAIDYNQKICYTCVIKNQERIIMTNRPHRYQKNRKNVCFALSVQHIEALHKISQIYGVNFSDVARYAILQFLKNYNLVEHNHG